MFNNLIESSSHAREFKRRGSFFLYTIAAYSLLFVGGGVASIYAYDAHLDEQAQELTILSFAPVPLKEISPTPIVRHNPAPNAASQTTKSIRPIVYDSPSDPKKVPEKTSALAVTIPPARPDSSVGPIVSDPPLPNGTSSNDVGRMSGTERSVIVEADNPPPPPVKKQAPQIVKASEPLNPRALELPKPPYPPLAKQIRLSGLVSVQVLIDETGRVVSAHAVSGHPVLTPGAVRAAYQARFSPAVVGETPVKVSGIINYNFVLE